MISKTKRFSVLVSLGMILSCCSGQAEDKGHTGTTMSEPTQTGSEEHADKELDMKKLSEAFGNFIGRNLQSPALKFDLDSLIAGIRKGAAGEPSPLSEKEYEEMMALVQERAFKEMSSSNLKSANDFISKNRDEEGVHEVVPGKLQYKVLKEGSGPTVETHSSPRINYTGKYQDGTVFGTSEEMGGPITIPLDQTIPGFSKGILGMKEGEKRRLFVHPDLGYGTTGQLPPNELLIFDIEVVKANDEDKAKKNLSSSKMHSNEDGDDDSDFSDDESSEDHSSSRDSSHSRDD